MFAKKIVISALLVLIASCSQKLNNKTQDQSLTVSTKQVEISINQEQEKAENPVVYFDTNSSELKSDAVAILQKDVIAAIKTIKSPKIVIEGHCDERGSVAYNKKLGKNRAAAVKSYLVKNGVKAKNIRIVSHGKSQPIAFGHDEESWSKNRRAVTIWVK